MSLITLRLARAEDAAACLEIYAPFITHSPATFETEVPEEAAFASHIEALVERRPWIIAEADGVVLGYAYATAHRSRQAYQWSVESSIYLRADARGKGLGRRLYASLFELLRLQGFFNVYAGVTLPNPGSVALHERMGFVPIGIYPGIGHKLGEWHDVGWWRLTLGELPQSPGAPVWLSALAPEAIEAILARG